MWRDARTLQLGTAQRHGVVLTGLRAGDDAVVAALDGTHSMGDLRALAGDRDLPERRAAELVQALDRAGALVREGADAADRAHLSRLGPSVRERLAGDAEAWSLAVPPPLDDGVQLLAGRAALQVVVDGVGRLGALLATVLAACGIGSVVPRDDRGVLLRDVGPGGHTEQDLGSPRATSAAAAVHRWSAQRAVPPCGPPGLVVLVRDDVVDVREADDLVRRDQPHLAVVCGADRVTVGPLVVPGEGACLRCLDLHRTDRDPSWPRVAAQLLAHQRTGAPRGETASGVMAAGLAAVQVLAHLDGRVPASARGRTLDVLLPDGAVERRRWSAHASCGCSRLPSDVTTGAPGHGRRP